MLLTVKIPFFFCLFYDCMAPEAPVIPIKTVNASKMHEKYTKNDLRNRWTERGYGSYYRSHASVHTLTCLFTPIWAPSAHKYSTAGAGGAYNTSKMRGK